MTNRVTASLGLMRTLYISNITIKTVVKEVSGFTNFELADRHGPADEHRM